MSNATARSEVLSRISTGELPTLADFTLVQVHTGGGICRGCGRAFSVGQPRCVIDCAAANLRPFPMHAECFFVWGEACVRWRKHDERAFKPIASRMFCRIRLEMLTDRMHTANEFAESVRRMRESGEIAARAACEQARKQSCLARETYVEHVRDHRC